MARRRKPWGRLHPLSLAVLAGVLVIVLVATVASWYVHDESEKRLLDQRTTEAGTVLSAAVGALQTPLAAAAEVAEVTDADARAFRLVLDQYVGPAAPFGGAALLAAGDTSPRTILGDTPLLQRQSADELAAVISRAQAAAGLVVIDGLQPDRRLGYAIAGGQQPRRFVVYAELSLGPPGRGTRNDGPFEDLHYAFYLGDREDPDRLLASSMLPPLEGRQASTVVPFGDQQLLLVLADTEDLGSPLSRYLPVLIAIIGSLLAVVAAVVTERLLRARDMALHMRDTMSGLYDDQQRVVETLQRSLLPASLPDLPGMTVATRYWPADRTSDVGGDFYDLFTLGPNRWGVMIGDVCGHGVAGAALTSLVRHTARAAARHGSTPADVLRWAHEAIAGYGGARTYATVCYAELTRRPDGTVRLVVALGGHPPPLVVRASGEVTAVGTHGTVLGLVRPHVSNSTTVLQPGDLLVLYTDGITDARPGESLTPEELAAAVAAGADQDLDDLADAIRDRLEDRRPGGSSDDAALLLLRVGPLPAGVDHGTSGEPARASGEAELTT